MSSDNSSQNSPGDNSKQEFSTKKKLKSSKSVAKSQKSMTIKSKEDELKAKKANLDDDSFYFSPILLVGLFIAAIGAGYLIPGSGGLNSPSYQAWSLIIAGLGICVPGLYQQIKHHYDNKKVSQTKTKKTAQ